ncbi:MAG: DNA-binding protein [Bryobacterales bacterium]|nr:DNA-binding protein [Bryobacterales bacterium]
MKRICLVFLACAAVGLGETGAPAPRVFGPSHVVETYRVLLDRNALLLESISDVIRQKGIQDGEVLVTAGSVQECTYHYVTTTDLKAKNVFKTVKGPFEILNAGGIIADGEPHIHITLSSPEKGAFGGHLEKGCKVLYLGEMTFFKYDGPALTRRANANGITLLEKK